MTKTTIAIALIAWQLTGSASTVRIVQTNSAGDNISLIDPVTNKVVAEITGIEVNHGAAVAPDGSRFFFSNEADHTLDVVSGKTLEVTKKIALSGRPNNIAISRDGRHVYVAIVSGGGAVDVIDAVSLARVKSIPTRGGVHNTFVTPDGKHVIAGSIVGKNLTVIDGKTEEPLWSLDFDAGVRPMAFEKKPDGSTGRLFVQLSNFHGFAVVDFETHRETGRIALPEVPAAQRHTEGLQGSPSHGIGVAPDGKTLWVNSKMNSHVYAYSLPDLTLLGGVHVGDHPDWLTFTPDSKSVYVANAGSNSVSVVDVTSRKEVMRIPVGQVPKRNITAVLP
jgi:YVTN family beta-propeller protein